jgi:hypothetical protein
MLGLSIDSLQVAIALGKTTLDLFKNGLLGGLL